MPEIARKPTDDAPTYDVVVIGGGPAGSAASTLIARAGRRVLQLERETFPRFKIGESLIPALNPVLERLGMVEKLAASHFPEKHSVQFYTEDGRASAPFYFKETEPEGQSQTWQVLRSDFDRMMVENARESGAEVREGAQVRRVLFDDNDRATGVDVRFDDGEEATISSRAVIDASGQRALLARQLGLRQGDPCLKMAAFFTHFEGAQRDPGIDEGATLILSLEGKNGWFWYIPLPDDKVSVGLVGPVHYLIKNRPGDPQQVFDEEVAKCPGLVPRIENARQAMDVKVLNDFSYSAERLAGDGWVLAGDAFTFLDPIYSSGVLLALRSGELAADAVIAGLADGDLSAGRLGAHEKRLRDAVQSFRKLVYAFYTKEFSFAGFLKKHPEHRLPIIKILVGDVFDRDFTALYDDMADFLPAWQKHGLGTAAGERELRGAA